MIYAVSDLHGYDYYMFLELLDSVGFGESDYLFVLGDVIDRGEHGIKLLKWMMTQPNVSLILGNHEAMMLSCEFLFDDIEESTLGNLNMKNMNLYSTWLSNGAAPTLSAMKMLHHSERKYILDYLYDAPKYETVSAGGRDFILTHSGLGNFRKDKKLSEYTDHELIWTRPTVYDEYFHDIKTVFGHTPTFFYGDEYEGRVLRTDTWINIDTGAGYGYKPTLLRLDDLQTFTLK